MTRETVTERKEGLNDTELEGEADGSRKGEGDE